MDTDEKSPGLSLSDLLALPEPLGPLLNWMVRQGGATLAEVSARLERDETRARELMADLIEKGYVREVDLHSVARYRVRLAPRRGGGLASSLWQALDEKVEREEEGRPSPQAAETERVFGREMEIARRIQASFLPEELPHFPGWEIAARFQPARQVAGDFYDAFPLVQNRRLGLVIGDVCDKGVGAALFMALARTLIRAFARQHYALRWMSDFTDSARPALPSIGTSALKNAIELTNDYIANTHGSTCMFTTLFFGILDPSTGLLLYVNGGHEHPFLIGAGGARERLATTGPVVGVFPDAHFEIRTARVEPGDTLVAFTDGVTEATDAAGELFGAERLRELLERPAPSVAELLDRVQAAVKAHSGAADASDDITLLAVRRQ